MKGMMLTSHSSAGTERVRCPMLATQRKWLRVDGAGDLSYVAVRTHLACRFTVAQVP
jgi:hypothetical protein